MFGRKCGRKNGRVPATSLLSPKKREREKKKTNRNCVKLINIPFISAIWNNL